MALVMVVDDREENCDLVTAVLARDGIDVVGVTDARQAVAQIAELAPGCVLLDQRMPHLSGLDVLERIRERFSALEVPVVMMTADTSRTTLHDAFAAGASDFVGKPFDLLELQHRVAAHVRNHELRAQLAEVSESRRAHATRLERILDAVDIALWTVDGADGGMQHRNGLAESPEGIALWDEVARWAVTDEVDELQHDRVHWQWGGQRVCHHVIRQRVEVDGRSCIVVAAYDDTDRERAARALEQALRREQETLATLRDVEEMRARFLAAASHELRTPLTVIRGTVEVAERQVEDPRLRELFTAATRHAHHLSDLVADVMTVVAGSAGVSRLAPVPLERIVRTAVQRLALDPAPGIEVDDLEVVGDVDLLSRALKALIDNADRHGGVTVRVRAAREGHVVTCRVEDDGPGLSDELRERVFEPFVQGSRGVDHRPGTGIGLTVARLLVEAHGGEVVLSRSADLGGLCAEVRLPQPRTPVEVTRSGRRSEPAGMAARR